MAKDSFQKQQQAWWLFREIQRTSQAIFCPICFSQGKCDCTEQRISLRPTTEKILSENFSVGVAFDAFCRTHGRFNKRIGIHFENEKPRDLVLAAVLIEHCIIHGNEIFLDGKKL